MEAFRGWRRSMVGGLQCVAAFFFEGISVGGGVQLVKVFSEELFNGWRC